MDAAQLSSEFESTIIPFSFTFDQYIDILVYNIDFFQYFLNSIILTVTILAGNMFICIITAFYLSRSRWKFKNVILVLYSFLALMPDQITMVPNIVFFQHVETTWGIVLMDTFWAIIIPSVFNTLGIVFLKQYFDTIPKSFYEVAELEGASHFYVLYNVVIRYAKYPIAALALFITMDIWGIIDRVLVFINDSGKFPGNIFLNRVAGDGLIYNAASILYIAPILFLLFIAYRGAKSLMYHRKETLKWGK